VDLGKLRGMLAGKPNSPALVPGTLGIDRLIIDARDR
jgi:hypothetical protein